MAKTKTRGGDTLESLARRYGVTAKQLAALKDPENVVRVGTRLKMKREERDETGRKTGGVLLQDPKYAAFKRNFDYNLDKVRSDFIEMKNRQQRELTRQEPVWEEQRRRAFENIDDTMEARGVFRSGQRILARGRADTDFTDQRMRYIDAQGEAREQARRARQEAVMGMKRANMEERLAARERLTLRDAETRFM